MRLTDLQGTTSRSARQVLPVLMYHSISVSKGDPGCLPVTVASFGAQVRALAGSGATILGLTAALRVKAECPDRFVVAMTFDDGYADFMNAAEILREHGAGATAYVCPGLLGSGHGGLARLSAGQLLELHRHGFEIGSHSMTHPPLDLVRRSELAYELGQSRRELEQIIGARVSSFCYPHGYNTAAIRRATAAAGYRNACVVGRRLATLAGDRYGIPRIEALDDADQRSFLRRVAHGEPGPAPLLRRAAAPGWRLARRALHRCTGRRIS